MSKPSSLVSKVHLFVIAIVEYDVKMSEILGSQHVV